ncbi:MAG: hypothetical protein EXX96DRAFT_536009 [Benjaminiella poitrasii]|nr:MAG: hypothetical protein EXX96DRAFT_536009 [Benjaminiella poitrasii]
MSTNEPKQSSSHWADYFLSSFDIFDKVSAADAGMSEEKEDQEPDFRGICATEWIVYNLNAPNDKSRNIVDEPAIKRLLDLQKWQIFSHSAAVITDQNQVLYLDQISHQVSVIVKMESRKVEKTAKIRGHYRWYSPTRIQELPDLVIEPRLSAR